MLGSTGYVGIEWVCWDCRVDGVIHMLGLMEHVGMTRYVGIQSLTGYVGIDGVCWD